MLHQAGAAEVVAIESNQRAFLRCLLVKELLGIERARFLHGDFVGYLRGTAETFDLCFASGVLYHMRAPVELIDLISRRAECLFLWTHYFDRERVSRNSRLRRRITASTEVEHAGFRHTLHRQRYGYSLKAAGFCGGSNAYSSWLSRADLLGALRHFGYGQIDVAFDEPDHPNGPALALVARRGSA